MQRERLGKEMAQLNFNANTVEPLGDFEPVPKGDYLAMMVDSEMKQTRNQDGEFLACQWELLSEDFKGRRLFDNLNLRNKNDTAVRIAQATLSSICRAVGVLQPKDSVELHNKPILLKVVVEERNDKPGVFQNRIKGYEAANAAQSPAPSNGTAKPPWKR